MKPYLYRIALPAVASLCWLIGCAGHTAKQMDMLTKESDELRQQQRRALSRIDEVEHQVMVLQEDLNRVRGGGDEIATAADGTQMPVVRLKADGSIRPPRGAKPAPRATKVSREKIAKSYDALFKKFNEKDCQETLLDFDQFVKKYPDSSLADNAQYWIGECYFRMEEFRLAIEEFQKVPESFPQGNKVPDAMLRIGMSYAALGNGGQARESYHKLVQDFPQSEAAQKAALQLEEKSVNGGS